MTVRISLTGIAKFAFAPFGWRRHPANMSSDHSGEEGRATGAATAMAGHDERPGAPAGAGAIPIHDGGSAGNDLLDTSGANESRTGIVVDFGAGILQTSDGGVQSVSSLENVINADQSNSLTRTSGC